MNKTHHQPELFPSTPSLTSAELSEFLNEGSRQSVSIALTRNRVSMLSVCFEPNGEIKLRLHSAFREAPLPVLRALQTYLRTRRRDAWHVASQYARSIQVAAPKKQTRRETTRGDVHDLAEIRTDINQRFFGGSLKCRVGWGSRRAQRRSARSRSIRFGTYCRERDFVLINPRLDSQRVPRQFVEYIVFHEMLHAVVPSVRRNGRWSHHPPEFRALERRFPDWASMQKISKKFVG